MGHRNEPALGVNSFGNGAARAGRQIASEHDGRLRQDWHRLQAGQQQRYRRQSP